jgi:hypothetical protein
MKKQKLMGGKENKENKNLTRCSVYGSQLR